MFNDVKYGNSNQILEGKQSTYRKYNHIFKVEFSYHMKIFIRYNF